MQVSMYRDALMYLSLSKANRECLVFYSPTPDNSCDVLFSADSDFSFYQKLPNIGNGSIITTPHHGSEHNKNAYITLKNQSLITRKSIFVRSDGRFKSRPGKSYKSLGAKKSLYSLPTSRYGTARYRIRFIPVRLAKEKRSRLVSLHVKLLISGCWRSTCAPARRKAKLNFLLHLLRLCCNTL